MISAFVWARSRLVWKAVRVVFLWKKKIYFLLLSYYYYSYYY